MKYIYTVLTMIILSFSISGAQDEYAAPEGALFNFTNTTYSNHIIFPEADWQADSQSFRFLYQQESSSLLFQYFISSKELRIIDHPWVCAFFFSDEQREIFRAVGCPHSISPNGRYAIYPTEEQICGEACSNVLALGDLEAGSYIPIRKAPDAVNFVRWSEESTAFLVLDYGQTGGLGGIWYASVPPSFSDLSDLHPTLLANFAHGDIGYVDISPDGKQVLVRGNGKTNNGFTLWDVNFLSSSQQFAAWADGQPHIENELIAGASFLPDDPHRLLVVINEGLVLYDLETKQTKLINPSINTQWADWTYFSPNAHYALVYDYFPDGKEGQQISVFPVELGVP